MVRAMLLIHDGNEKVSISCNNVEQIIWISNNKNNEYKPIFSYGSDDAVSNLNEFT